MPFANHRLRYAFEGQGELGSGVAMRATDDPLEELLAPGYFTAAHGVLRAGDLLFVGSTPLPLGSPWLDRTGETRRALLMIGPVRPGQPISARLVQDYGRPTDPSPPLDPAARTRPRGRRQPSSPGARAAPPLTATRVRERPPPQVALPKPI